MTMGVARQANLFCLCAREADPSTGAAVHPPPPPTVSVKVVRDVDGAGRPIERLEAVGLDRDDAVLVLHHAFDDQRVRADDDRAVRSKRCGVTMALAKPVSSSRVMKTNPLAVPGRWRTITTPATRARLPCGTRAELGGARDAPARRSVGAREARPGAARSMMPVPREVGGHLLALASSRAAATALVGGGDAAANSAPERPSASTCHSASRRVAAAAPRSAPISRQRRQLARRRGSCRAPRSRPATRTARAARSPRCAAPTASRSPAT